LDLVIETELKPHDVVPLVPIIAGAGGLLTSWDGGSALSGGRIVAAGDRRVHAAVLQILNERSYAGLARPKPAIGGRAALDPPYVTSIVRRPSSEQRRARDECVERRPKLLSVAIALHQDLVARSRDHEVRADAQARCELSRHRRRDDVILAGRDDQDRLADALRILRLGEVAHDAIGGIHPRHGRRAKPELRLGLHDRGGAPAGARVGAEAAVARRPGPTRP